MIEMFRDGEEIRIYPDEGDIGDPCLTLSTKPEDIISFVAALTRLATDEFNEDPESAFGDFGILSDAYGDIDEEKALKSYQLRIRQLKKDLEEASDA